MPRNEQAARSRLLGGCDAWHAVPLPHTKFLSHSDHEFNLGVHRPELRSEVLACSRPTELGTLDSYRFGPFESHGGGFHAERGDEWSQSWLRVSSYENFPPGPYQGGLGRYEAAVLGYVIAPVDLNGSAWIDRALARFSSIFCCSSAETYGPVEVTNCAAVASMIRPVSSCFVQLEKTGLGRGTRTVRT